MSPKLRRMLALLVLAILALFALVVWMADGIQTPESFEPAPRRIEGVEARTSTRTNELTVVTWNVAWAYGWGSEGSGSFKEKAHFDRSLARMGETLAALAPDVVLLQEVDFDATRSHHTNQAEVLARAAGLPYVAEAVSWRANWIPFPYWPPRDHFGEMSSGGAILSRLPLTAHRVQLMAKPSENPFWYNIFYLFRYYETAEVKVGEQGITLVNTHLEAFHRGTRMEEAGRLAQVLSDVEDEHLIFGGDLNSVPPEAASRGEYADEPKTDHTEDRTIAILRAVDGLSDTMPDVSTATETATFTFPSHDPNRKLDYLFYGRGLELLEARVVTEAGTASDHLPVLARWRIR